MSSIINEMADLMRAFIHSPEKTAATLDGDIQACSSALKGLVVTKKNLGKELTQEQLQKQMKDLVGVIERTVQAQRNSSLMMLALAVSGDFQSTASQVMVKLGHGEEALKTMFEQKLKKGG